MEQQQLIDVLMVAIDNAMANLHTATIAKITAVNDTTINCRPVINRVVEGESIELPEFIEVPPLMMQGGGSYVAMPIAVGDYCLLMFTERCFDRWYDGQDYQSPLELRMHDYSDGIALVGLKPLAAGISIPTQIHIEGDSEQTGTHTLTGDLIVDGKITATGDIEADGEVAALAAVPAVAVHLSTHVHTDSVGGSTTSPTPGS